MERKKLSLEATVGAFVLILVVILFWITMKVGGFGARRVAGYHVQAGFNSAQGVNDKTSVFIAGIKVGEVELIALENGKAIVTMKIMKDVKLGQDSKAIIRTRGLLGEKFIDLQPGSPDAEPIQEGGEIIRTDSPPDFEELITQWSMISKDIKNMSEKLNQTVDTNTELVNKMVSNLERFTRTLAAEGPILIQNARAITESLDGMLNGNKDNIEESISQFREAAVKFQESLDNLESITSKIDEGKGTIGKLINDETTVDKLNQAIDGVNTFIASSSRFRVFIDYRGEYQYLPENLKSYLNLRLEPKPDKYYLIGITSDPTGLSSWERTTTSTDGSVTETYTETVEDRVKFNLEIAKRLWFLTLRGGIIESTGGVGLDLEPWRDQIILSFEAMDFGRDNNPYLKGTLMWTPWRYVFLTGGANDFINKYEDPLYFFGAGLRFEDEDIKGLFGMAAGAATATSK